MSGNLLTNSEIHNLIGAGVISITPSYDVRKLQIAQYPLLPHGIFEIAKTRSFKEVFKFSNQNTSFKLRAKKYYVIDVYENIKLPRDIVGRFIPASSLIEKGLVLSYGKIEYPFGQNKEKIRFGIFNCLDIETDLKAEEIIAYVQFFDLRGKETIDYQLTERDKKVYLGRTYEDWDGPNYERDNSE